MRILLVENNTALRKKICEDLKQYNYVIDCLNTEKINYSFIKHETFEAILLDDTACNLSSLKALKVLRQRGYKAPIIVLMAHDSAKKRVEALNSGADDCINPLPHPEELSAKIQALHRRFTTGQAQPHLVYRDIIVDPTILKVTVLGKPISISRREFSLLQKLLENVGKVVSREILLQCLYGWKAEIDSNTLEVHMHNLRKKLTSLFIRTIRGVGYAVEIDRKN